MKGRSAAPEASPRLPPPARTPLKPLYFDHNAATPVDEAALREMLPYFVEKPGNPSSVHARGREARVAVDQARARIARAVGAHPDEVILTSGGTEANNLAVLGSARAATGRGRHVLATAIEHASVLEPCSRLAAEGFELEILPVDAQGLVDPEAVRRAVRPDTILVCAMAANNETGALQPVEDVFPLLPPGALLHCDATQLPGKLPLTPAVRRAPLVAFSSQKLCGPKGAGALVVRPPAALQPLLHGGGQERNLRPGTENVPAIVGFAAALERAIRRTEEYRATVGALAARLLDSLRERLPGSRLLGPEDPSLRLPNTFALSFPVFDGRALVAALDLAGVSVSAGSACSSGASTPSHVLHAMGVSPAAAACAVRFSLGWGVERADIDEAVARISTAVRPLLRPGSPNILGP